jgi:xylulokinase
VLCGLFAGLDALTDAGVVADGTIHLVGGGARSATYRQRCADLAGAPVAVPDNDEVVAVGAAVQAAALGGERSTAEIARAWSLGAGTTVEPRDIDGGDAVRVAYREVAAREAELPRHAPFGG